MARRAHPHFDADFDGVWQRVQAAPHTLGPTPGAREAWHRGRQWYAVWLLRAVEPMVVARQRQVHAVLGDLVGPAPAPHITVFVAGFPRTPCTFDDDVEPAVLVRQARAVAGSGPVRVVVGGANSFTSAAFLDVSDPFGDLGRLRARLLDGAEEVRFAPPTPHLTVGAYRHTGPVDALVERLAPLRVLPPLPLTLEVLELVELDAAIPDGPLHTRRRVALTAACDSGRP